MNRTANTPNIPARVGPATMPPMADIQNGVCLRPTEEGYDARILLGFALREMEHRRVAPADSEHLIDEQLSHDYIDIVRSAALSVPIFIEAEDGTMFHFSPNGNAEDELDYLKDVLNYCEAVSRANAPE